MRKAADELTLPAPARLWTIALGLLLALIVFQAAAWPLAMRTSDAAAWVNPWLAWPAWMLATGGPLGFFAVAVATRRFEPLAGWALAGATVLALFLGGLATRPGGGASYAHPAFALALASAVAIATALPWRATLLSGAAILAAYLAGIYRTLALGLPALAPTLSTVAQLILVSAVAAVAIPSIFAAAEQQQRTRGELTSARRAVTAQRARDDERARQYRLIHDTVLSTLTGLSRGSLDPQDPAVRLRLAGDADYLRGLIATTESRAGMFLVGELARISRDLQPAGLRVHPHIDDVPDALPDDVAHALAEAAREALNNVVKHAGTLEAWVTLSGGMPGPDGAPAKSGSVVLMVTDRGCGFDPATTRGGIGLRNSLHARMKAVGGTCFVDSEPGQGTTIELGWPAA